MNLHKLTAKKDDGRGSLALVNVEESRVVATDGYIMAIVPNDGEMAPGLYTAESWAKHEKDEKYPLEKGEDGLRFPDYQAIVDQAEGSKTVFKIALDISLLEKLADALRKDKKSSWRMVLEFSGKDEAVMVYPLDTASGDRKGVIMPCHISGGA
jgi:hypothetical protein